MAYSVVHGWRALHVLDLENLARGSLRKRDLLGAAWRYSSVARIGRRDLVEVAMDAGAWREVAFDLPQGWRVRFGRGPNGADRALLDAIDPALAIRRFDRVVIGSGDGCFAGLANQLRAAGLHVEVVSARGSLNQRLARAASAVKLLSGPSSPPPPAARQAA